MCKVPFIHLYRWKGLSLLVLQCHHSRIFCSEEFHTYQLWDYFFFMTKTRKALCVFFQQIHFRNARVRWQLHGTPEKTHKLHACVFKIPLPQAAHHLLVESAENCPRNSWQRSAPSLQEVNPVPGCKVSRKGADSLIGLVGSFDPKLQICSFAFFKGHRLGTKDSDLPASLVFWK